MIASGCDDDQKGKAIGAKKPVEGAKKPVEKVQRARPAAPSHSVTPAFAKSANPQNRTSVKTVKLARGESYWRTDQEQEVLPTKWSEAEDTLLAIVVQASSEYEDGVLRAYYGGRSKDLYAFSVYCEDLCQAQVEIREDGSAVFWYRNIGTPGGRPSSSTYVHLQWDQDNKMPLVKGQWSDQDATPRPDWVVL